MFKILCIGDPHIKVDNISEFENFEEKLFELIKNEKPDFIVCLGDILHTHERLHTIALNKAYSFIDKLRSFCTTYLLVGNHDYIHNQEYLTSNHWMNSLKEWKNVNVADNVIHLSKGDKLFVFCPYVFPGKFKEALSTNTECDWKQASIIFAHQEMKGCKMGPIVSVEGDEWDDNLPCIISGHIHSNQSPSSNIYYPGSALQNAFGESERNIIPIIELEEGKKGYSLREIDLGLPRKKIISYDIDKIDNAKINNDNGDKIKLNLKGNYEDFKSFKKTTKYKELVDKGITIVFKNKPDKEQDDKDVKDDQGSNGVKDDKDVNDIEIKEDTFKKLLLTLVLKEQNKNLYSFYEKIINNNDILVL